MPKTPIVTGRRGAAGTARPEPSVAKKRGPVSRFPGKVPVPFPLCLTPALHVTLNRTAERLGLKRGDVICELLTRYADKLHIQ